MRLKIKEAVTAVLSKEQGVILEEALDQLAGQTLDARTGWRVRQLEHCLCEKTDGKELLEP